MMLPSRITRISSASRMVDSRWAITKLVRPCISTCIAFWMKTSVRVSTLLVALVQDQDRRVGQDGAGDGQQLALALRDAGGLGRPAACHSPGAAPG